MDQPPDADALDQLLEMGQVVQVPTDDSEAPEGDVLDQAYVVEPEEVALQPSSDPEAPAADAMEQARLINRDMRDGD